jgi:hypothetical protein
MVRRLEERYPDHMIVPAHDRGAAEPLRRANAG